MARLAHRQCDRQTNKKQKRWQCARRKAKNKHAKTKAKQQQNKCVRVFCLCVCELPKSMHAARNSSRTQTRRGEGGTKGARRRLQCCKCQLELTELHAEHTQQQQQQSYKKEMFRCGATETATTNSSRCRRRRRQGSMRTSASFFLLLLLLLRLLVAWRRHLTFS